MRRWVSAAAALVVIAAAAAITPALVRSLSPSPAEPSHAKPPPYTVTVKPVGRDAALRGVIGQGITDGKHWQVTAHSPQTHASPHSTGKVFAVNVTASFGIESGTDQVQTGWPVAFEYASGTGSHSSNLIYGTVSRDITTVTVSLANGDILTLRPVAWRGYRWVAFVLPWQARMTRAVAYQGSREAAYSVPFQGGYDVWWRPGQAGPARVVKKLGSGVTDGIKWQLTADIGPWGYCYVSAGLSWCYTGPGDPQRVSAAKPVSAFNFRTQDPGHEPWFGAAGVALGVRRVLLTYSNGSSASFPAVAVGGDRVVAFAVPTHLRVVASVEYGAAGQVLGAPRAALWNPPSG